MSNSFLPTALHTIPLDSHLVIEASAGTGKTYAIERLVLELLASGRCTIDQLLIVTFTEKATSELRVRIRDSIEQTLEAARKYPAVTEQTDRLRQALFAFGHAWIGTIHGFCHRVLTDAAFDAGIRLKIDVIDGREVFHRAFRDEIRDELATDAATLPILANWLSEDDPSSRADRIDAIEDLLYQAHTLRYIELCHAPLSASGDNNDAQLIDRLLPRILHRLRLNKCEAGLIDYSDMLESLWDAIAAPSGEALLSSLRQRFRLGLIDEFQDTDELQWKILKRIFVEGSRNVLYVVADPKQAIYGFRGADIYTYLKAREELQQHQARVATLRENFRSTALMVSACNIIFDNNARPPIFTGHICYDAPTRAGRPLLSATTLQGATLKPITLMRFEPESTRSNASTIRRTAGRWIATRIRGLLSAPEEGIFVTDEVGDRRQVKADGIFVLTRTHKESREMGSYLRAAGVPFVFYKLAGLFQTAEAYHVLDVLRAIQTPQHRSRQLKAFYSPFFQVAFDKLGMLSQSESGVRLTEQLIEWKALARAEGFSELFDQLLHRSGLAPRELFVSDNLRALTNYEHIFESLLEDALEQQLSLDELISTLESYIAEKAYPPGLDSNCQRATNEGGAVQVMTVHMSKGLEADVVFLFGGLWKAPDKTRVVLYHEGYERRVAIADEKKAVAGILRKEADEEDQRLAYVAMTRARVKLYLPLLPGGVTRKLSGYYACINRRLLHILSDLEPTNDYFEMESLDKQSPTQPADDDNLITWSPPPELLEGLGHSYSSLRTLRSHHSPLAISSYTALGRSHDDRSNQDDDELDLERAHEDLPGGRRIGLFLHDVLQKLDIDSVLPFADSTTWRACSDVRALFADAMRRHRVADGRWLEHSADLVFNALHAPIAAHNGVILGPLCRRDCVREMEFTMPIPRLAATPGSEHLERWTVEKGYLKGYIDLVFECNGLTYFVDWKSDILDSYAGSTISDHVSRNYALQAKIYSVGVVRLLRISNEMEYDERFGGLLYLFLRGMEPDDGRSGVHFARPTWKELIGYENELAGLGAVGRT